MTDSNATAAKRYGRAPEAARLLDVPLSTFYGMCRRQPPPPGVMRVGRSIRVDIERLQKWADAGGDLAVTEERATQL